MFIQVRTFLHSHALFANNYEQNFALYLVCYKSSHRCNKYHYQLIAVNQQVQTAMALLLRLLPLLVVGCLLLQSLQPTAVSGQEVCDQTIEGSDTYCSGGYFYSILDTAQNFVHSYWQIKHGCVKCAYLNKHANFCLFFRLCTSNCIM